MCSRIWLGVLALLCSCSIKEDRGECFATLRIDLSDIPYAYLLEEGYDCLQVLARQGEWMSFEMLMLEDRPQKLELKSPRGAVEVSVFCGARRQYSPSSGVVIPLGEPSPELMLFRSEAVGVDEGGGDTRVVLHKNFCLLSLVYKTDLDYGLQVEGGVCGYDSEWRPVPGAFRAEVLPDVDGRCSVVLPRQLDDELTLNVVRGPRVLRGFALGRFMAEAGYDWRAEDLEDITIRVDYSTSMAFLTVGKWTQTYEFDLEL